MKLLTKDLRLTIAKELVEVRADNNSEGTEYFQMMMFMLTEDERYDADFNSVMEMAAHIEGAQ